MKKKRFMVKSIAVLLTLCMAFAFVACNKGKGEGNSNAGLTESDVEVWTTYATEKILQDQPNYYEDVKLPAEISVSAVRGEYESSQIIITASKDVNKFSVSVTDLTSSDGKTFPKERINVYHEKYMQVTTIFRAGTNSIPGYYPDALLPVETAEEWGETKVKAGQNQGLYVTFNVTPKTDENGYIMNGDNYVYYDDGVYTGSITIDFGTFKKVVPVALEILPVTLPETNHVQSHFGNRATIGTAELSYTQETKNAWVQRHYDYRMTPASVLSDYGYNQTTIDRYMVVTAEFGKSVQCASIEIPVRNATTKYWDEAAGETEADATSDTNIDKQFFKDFVFAYVKLSAVQEFNYVEKLTLGCGLIDEPQMHNRQRRTKAVMKEFRDAREESAAEMYDYLLEGGFENDESLSNNEILALDSMSEPFRKEIIASILNIKMPVTCDFQPDYDIETYCPHIAEFDSQEQRDKFNNDQKEKAVKYETRYHEGYSLAGRSYVDPSTRETKTYPDKPYKYDWYDYKESVWWYTSTPGMCFDFEIPLTSIRVNGWEMAEYNIDGFLYWSSDLFAKDATGGSGTYLNVEGYYDHNDYRYTNSNGNGYLFYPGGQYELDSPVPSIRVEAYRDGLEEYELMYMLRERYEELGFNADEVIANLGSTLYTGIVSRATSAMLAASRKSLLQLVSAVSSSAKMAIAQYSDDGYGNIEYDIYLADGYKLYNNGTEVTATTTVGGIKTYSVKMKLENVVNMLSLTFEADGITYEYTQNLGGKVEMFGADLFNGAFSKSTVTPSQTLEGDYLNVTFPESGISSQRAKLGGGILNKFTNGVNRMILHINNPASDAVMIDIMVKKSNSDVYTTLVTYSLAPGLNAVEFTISDGWDGVRATELMITIGDGKNQPEHTIGFKDLVIYYN